MAPVRSRSIINIRRERQQEGHAIAGDPTPDTPLHGAETVGAVLGLVEQLAAGFARNFPELPPSTTGLIAPSIIDHEPGINFHPANLYWENVPFDTPALQSTSSVQHAPSAMSLSALADPDPQAPWTVAPIWPTGSMEIVASAGAPR
jgi:hypothetical protein